MEKKSDIIAIAKQFLERSYEKLTSAQILLERDRIDDAISRAYYAAFLAARGLLYLLGLTPKSHSGVLTMFGLKVIKEELLPPKTGKALNELYGARENSDNGIIVYYNEEDGRKYLDSAREIVESIKKLMETRFNIRF